MKQKIQIGIEGFKGEDRLFRLTPIDAPIDVQPQVAIALAAGESFLDTRDIQPGDGEIDVPIPLDKAKAMFPWAASHINGADRVNMFVNFK